MKRKPVREAFRRLASLLLATCIMAGMAVVMPVPASATNATEYTQTFCATPYLCLFIKNDHSLWCTHLRIPYDPYHPYTLSEMDWCKGKTATYKVMDNTKSVYTSGNGSCYAIKTDGSLWVWGNNNGALGDGTTDTRTMPVKIMDNVIQVSGQCYRWTAGVDEHGGLLKKTGYATYALKTDGTLWAWGTNHFGELGNGSTTQQLKPVKVMDGVVYITSTESTRAERYSPSSPSVYTIRTDGSLWAWGVNSSGQLGDGTQEERTKPMKIIENVRSIFVNDAVCAAIQDDSSLWVWGSYWRKSGVAVKSSPEKIADNVTQAAMSTEVSFFVKSDHTLFAWGDYKAGLDLTGTGMPFESDTPVKIFDNVKYVQNNGIRNAFAIKTDGSLYGWGMNTYAQVGTSKFVHDLSSIPIPPEEITDQATEVQMTVLSTYALKSDGTLWGWGVDQYGNFAQKEADRIYPTPVKIASDVMQPVTPGPDIPSDWATETIAAAVDAGLVPKTLQKNYRRPLSRISATQLFVNLIEQSSGQTIEKFLTEQNVQVDKNTFSDTTDRAVLAASALGIVNGVGDNKFNPDRTLTRAQAATIINRIAEVMGVETAGYTHGFSDMNSHWASMTLGWPVHVGIISGVGNNRFSPDGILTCEQAIAIAYRAMGVLKD